MKTILYRITRPGAFAMACALLLAACGTARAEFAWPDLEEIEPITDIREVPRDTWARKAIAYSGFREGQSPTSEIYPSDVEVLEDLRLLLEEGFGLLRVYSAAVHGRQVVELIDEHDLDLKVQLGAYVSGSFASNPESNTREIESAIELANRYPDVVMAVSVGNETLVSWSFVAVPPREIAGYVRHVRSRIAQPVTVNDNWEPFAAGVGQPVQKVWTQIDYASIHTYAYWDAGFNFWPFRQKDAETTLEEAFRYARKNFRDVRTALDAAGIGIPIVIGETGWQNVPSAALAEAEEQDFARVLAGPKRQKMYYEHMQGWAYGASGSDPGDGYSRPAAMFYFAAFDEPWKQADDNWGLWDADRKRKPALGED